MRILAIRFSALGDVAMTVPVMLEVLEQNPDVHIDFVTRPFMTAVIPEHPRLKAIGVNVDSDYKGFWGLRKLAVELKRNGKYDAVADLHYVLRSRTISMFLRTGKLKVAHMNKGRNAKKLLTRPASKVRGALRPMTERYADVFRSLGLSVKLSHTLQSSGTRSGIGFAPFAQHKGKAWPLTHARDLLGALNSEGRNVVLFGGPNEFQQLSKLAENLSSVSVHRGNGLASDIEAMKSLRVMISMDSANMHLASIAQTPVVSIWGATHTDAGFLGYGQRLEDVVEMSVDELECRPCSVFGNVPCARGDWACMEQLGADQVLRTIHESYKLS